MGSVIKSELIMAESGLGDQYSELLASLSSGGIIAGRIAVSTVKVSWNTLLFLLSCGSLVRWSGRHPAVPRGVKPSDSYSSNISDEVPEAVEYLVINEMNPSIPHSASRERLNQLIQSHSFARKDSWIQNSRDREDVVIIPSLSLDSEELKKVSGVETYEERQLCTLFYLKNPKLRLIYVTSMPVDKATVDYYLALLEQNSTISKEDAYSRLFMLSCNDSSVIPLSAKILRRPRLIQKLKSYINQTVAHMICFISSNLERDIALQLEIPLFSNDPSLSYWGTKVGSRLIFEQAGIKYAKGTPLTTEVTELVAHIAALYEQEDSSVTQFVVKLNIGFSGEGNAILKTTNFDAEELHSSIKAALMRDLEFGYHKETWESFVKKIQQHGALAEVWVPDVVGSPSCQGLINPKGQVELLSTHEQLLVGPMIYQGCTFPCNESYRRLLMDSTREVGEVLASKGCRERFAVDYVVVQSEDGEWQVSAIEINLRWGGTSHPMVTTKYITDAEFTSEGLLLACDDRCKYYVATDCIKHDVFTGLTAEDFIELVHSKSELQFDSDSATGIVYHLLAAVSVHGKFGFTAIANSPEEAASSYDRTIELLKQEATELSHKKRFTELDLSIPVPTEH